MNKKSIVKWLSNRFFDNDLTKAESFFKSFVHLVSIGDPFDSKFSKARTELLSICKNNAHPYDRWENIKSFLTNNISNLIYQPSKFRNNEITYLERILEPESTINDTLRFLFICNAIDYENSLPETVYIIKNGDYVPSWELSLDIYRLSLVLKNDELKNCDIERKLFLDNYYKKFCIFESNKKTVKVKQSELFREFSKRFESVVNPNRTNFEANPSKYLGFIREEVRNKFLSKIIGVEAKWKLKSQNIDGFDYKGMINKFDIDEKDISEINQIDRPNWVSENLLLNLEKLKFELFDYFIDKKELQLNKRLIIRLAKQIGYKIFYSTNISNYLLNGNHKGDKSMLDTLQLIFEDIYEINKRDIESIYWKIYNTVEYHKGLNFKKQYIFELLEPFVKMKKTTIGTRYKERCQLSVKPKYKNKNLAKIYGFYFLDV